jgi:hypothetical protein
MLYQAGAVQLDALLTGSRIPDLDLPELTGGHQPRSIGRHRYIVHSFLPAAQVEALLAASGIPDLRSFGAGGH